MVALFILTTSMIGILSLLAQSLYLSKTVQNETIATYLAAEGIELSKSIIDHDVYAQRASVPGVTGWGVGDPDTAFGSGGEFQFDYTICTGPSSPCGIVPLASIGPPDVRPIGFNPITHLYYYGAPETTPFSRVIKVSVPTAAPGNNELDVQSIVTWSTGPFTTQSVQLEDVFYNWVPS